MNMTQAQQKAVIRVTNAMQASTHRTLSFTIEKIGDRVFVMATNCYSSHALESLYCAQALVGPRGGISHEKMQTFH